MMNIFPTRILLATDGSENVTHATTVAKQPPREAAVTQLIVEGPNTLRR